MAKKIKIPFFPLAFKIISIPVLLAVGVYLVWKGHWAWSILLFLSCVAVLTTDYITEVDLHEKRYSDYLSFLTFRFNSESDKFASLDRIIIVRANYSQNVNTRFRSTQRKWTEYSAILLYDTDGTLDIVTKNDKAELLKILKEFSNYLNIGVEDRTTRDPYWIDMAHV